jgi:hypothetical protein
MSLGGELNEIGQLALSVCLRRHISAEKKMTTRARSLKRDSKSKIPVYRAKFAELRGHFFCNTKHRRLQEVTRR